MPKRALGTLFLGGEGIIGGMIGAEVSGEPKTSLGGGISPHVLCWLKGSGVWAGLASGPGMGSGDAVGGSMAEGFWGDISGGGGSSCSTGGGGISGVGFTAGLSLGVKGLLSLPVARVGPREFWGFWDSSMGRNC